MKRTRLMILMASTCLILSGCGRIAGTVAERPDPYFSMDPAEVEEDSGHMSYDRSIPVNEALMEPMMIGDGIDRNVIADRAREKIRSGFILGFPENGGLPAPESCVEGFSVKEHASYVYIYRMADGDAAYDEVEMFSAVLAYLSVLEDCGFRIDTYDAMTKIYDGTTEAAHFVIAGTQDSGYLMYLQLMN